MLRCITEDDKSIIATTCDPESTRVLSRAHKLFCPNCKGIVQYNKGRVKSSYFSHVNLKCEYVGYEPETTSHIKGKEILYGWLKTCFPTAYVEYEEHIPETGQIADIYIEHTEGEYKGLRWAFEFQHSPLTITDWEERHNLYKIAGIQDFWILDKAKYMKFSKAKGHTNARKRNELEKKIYNEVGLCYFLDLEKEELTIDFNFVNHSESNVFNRKRVVTDYTYHRPEHHAAHINQIRFRMNNEFKYCVLLYDLVEDQMNDRLLWILQKLIREQKLKLEEELRLRISEKKSFASTIYQEEEVHIVKRFINVNDKGLAEDIRSLKETDFFEKHKKIIEKLIINIQTYKSLEESHQLKHKLISKLIDSWDIYELSFLVSQSTYTLEEYLTVKFQDKLMLVEYAYNTYKDIFEELASRHTKMTGKALAKIKWYLAPNEKNPTTVDYALPYRRCETIDEIDGYIEKVKEKIINFNPFDSDEW